LTLNLQTFDITATMGPSCSTEEIIGSMIGMGVTSFRFPFAKETPEWQVKQAFKVKEIAEKLGTRIDTIMDLPGSQPRTTNNSTIVVSAGDILALCFEPEREQVLETLPSEVLVGLSQGQKLADTHRGDILVVGDGELAFSIEKLDQQAIICKALLSGSLRPRRGVTIQGYSSIYNSLTESDIDCIKLLRTHQFDRVLLSFVNTRHDIQTVRSLVESLLEGGTWSPIISVKVETNQAIENIRDIVELADHIVVGRGDLALQTGILRFYEAQETAISTAIEMGKPVQVGTQLMESAGDNWLPYRAEISDTCALITKGISGILLSAETTIGKDPARVVGIISELAKRYHPYFYCSTRSSHEAQGG
jgi:pyruvate kinase